MRVAITEVALFTALGGTDASLSALGLGEAVRTPMDNPESANNAAPAPRTHACLPNLETEGLQARLLSLALPPLRELTGRRQGLDPLPLNLALPAIAADPGHQQAHQLFGRLRAQFPGLISTTESGLYPFGRAAGLMALEAGWHQCRQLGQPVLVGAVDSHWEQRKQFPADNAEGWIAGESAVFVLLETAPDKAGLIMLGGATEMEATTDRSAPPAGLGRALARLSQGHNPAVGTLFPGFNGDPHWITDWSHAQQANRHWIRPDFKLHSAGFALGDTGAALGLINLACAWHRARQGLLGEPALITACSEGLYRSAVLVGAATDGAANEMDMAPDAVAADATETSQPQGIGSP